MCSPKLIHRLNLMLMFFGLFWVTLLCCVFRDPAYQIFIQLQSSRREGRSILGQVDHSLSSTLSGLVSVSSRLVSSNSLFQPTPLRTGHFPCFQVRFIIAPGQSGADQPIENLREQLLLQVGVLLDGYMVVRDVEMLTLLFFPGARWCVGTGRFEMEVGRCLCGLGGEK